MPRLTKLLKVNTEFNPKGPENGREEEKFADSHWQQTERKILLRVHRSKFKVRRLGRREGEMTGKNLIFRNTNVSKS